MFGTPSKVTGQSHHPPPEARQRAHQSYLHTRARDTVKQEITKRKDWSMCRRLPGDLLLPRSYRARKPARSPRRRGGRRSSNATSIGKSRCPNTPKPSPARIVCRKAWLSLLMVSTILPWLNILCGDESVKRTNYKMILPRSSLRQAQNRHGSQNRPASPLGCRRQGAQSGVVWQRSRAQRRHARPCTTAPAAT